jgi:hypothetical protein
VCIGAANAEGREQLCRYALRPCFALERLSALPDGRLSYRVKISHGWRAHRATHRIMTPLDLPVRITVTYPDGDSVKTAVYPTSIFLGLKENFVWKFGTPDELVPGRWSIEVELFSADSPDHYPFNGKLAPKSSIGRLRQEFSVVLP